MAKKAPAPGIDDPRAQTAYRVYDVGDALEVREFKMVETNNVVVFFTGAGEAIRRRDRVNALRIVGKTKAEAIQKWLRFVGYARQRMARYSLDLVNYKIDNAETMLRELGQEATDVKNAGNADY